MYIVKRFRPIHDAILLDAGKPLEDIEMIEGRADAIERATVLTMLTHWPHVVIEAGAEEAVCRIEWNGYGLNTVEF